MSDNEKTVFCEIGEGRVKKIKFTSNSTVGDAEALRQSLIKAAEKDSHLYDKINGSTIILQCFVKEASLYVDVEEDDDIEPNCIIKIRFLKTQTIMEVLSPSPEPSTSSNNSSSNFQNLIDEKLDFVLDVEDIPLVKKSNEGDVHLNENENESSTSCFSKSKKQKIQSQNENPFILPALNNNLKTLLFNDKIITQQDWNTTLVLNLKKFISFWAVDLLSKTNQCPTMTDYNLYSLKIVEAYPILQDCINAGAKRINATVSRQLSSRVRNTRFSQKKATAKVFTNNKCQAIVISRNEELGESSAKDNSEEQKAMIEELKKASEKGTDLRHINRLLKETFEFRRQIVKRIDSCADVIIEYPFLMKCDVVLQELLLMEPKHSLEELLKFMDDIIIKLATLYILKFQHLLNIFQKSIKLKD